MCAQVPTGTVVDKRWVHSRQVFPSTSVNYTNMNRGSLRDQPNRSNCKHERRDYGCCSRDDSDAFTIHTVAFSLRQLSSPTLLGEVGVLVAEEVAFVPGGALGILGDVVAAEK